VTCYDFVDLGTSKIGILVADVSGHGIPAALVGSMVKLAFTTQGEHAHDPARVLNALNRALCRQLKQGFVTAVYGVIDLERRVMTAANAGHPWPLIGRSDGSIVEIQEHGLLLGLLPDASYVNTEIDLREGDLILLYTDGVTEAQNAKAEFFDVERVRQWLTSEHRDSAARLTEAALTDLIRWCGHSSFHDDVTFVVARVTSTA
jgi:sigma-B regulation protein RsbU (phosphoserine phosphatase)